MSGIILLLALGVRLTLLFGFQRYEVGRPEPIRIAISLAQHGSFANPYAIPTGPTAHTAPLYPMLIAPLYAIWGNTHRADLARFALNALAAACEYALLPAVAMALGLGLWPGVLAGLGGALIPLHYWVECMGDFETTWTALFLEVATILFARFVRAPRGDSKSALRAGCFWGAGLLLAPVLLPVLMGFLVIGAWKWRPGAGAACRWLGVFSAGLAMMMTPWLVRNAVQLGGVFFIRDDLGLELFVSNHDGASADAEVNYGKPYWATAHPFSSAAVAGELLRMGEGAFERRKLGEALEWIRGHPREFRALTAARARAFWFPAVPRFLWLLWTATAAGLAAFLFLARDARFAAVVLGSILVGYAAIFLVVQGMLRYQHPLWWIEVLLIGWAAQRWLPGGAENLWRKFGQRARQREGERR
jgi:hypothetical protein